MSLVCGSVYLASRPETSEYFLAGRNEGGASMEVKCSEGHGSDCSLDVICFRLRQYRFDALPEDADEVVTAAEC